MALPISVFPSSSLSKLVNYPSKSHISQLPTNQIYSKHIICVLMIQLLETEPVVLTCLLQLAGLTRQDTSVSKLIMPHNVWVYVSTHIQQCVGETRALFSRAASQSAEPHFVKIKLNGIQQKQPSTIPSQTKHLQVSTGYICAPCTHSTDVASLIFLGSRRFVQPTSGLVHTYT